MDAERKSRLGEILRKYESELVGEWILEQLKAVTLRRDLISDNALRQQSSEFVRLLSHALDTADTADIMSDNWGTLREMLAGLSKSRAVQGFTASETATFIFSFKKPFFERLGRELQAEPDTLAYELWTATLLLDKLGLFTTEVFQESREQIISRQQSELLELSTPVVQLWPGILCIPLIGTLDSERTQIVMESLLQKIGDTGSEIAIIDISGVPTVDTLVAQHLLRTVSAARLMGAECLVSGISPQIAQTVVHLGIKLSDVITRASLFSALDTALSSLGLEVRKRRQ